MAKAKRRSKSRQTKLPPKTKPSPETKSSLEIKSPETEPPLGSGPIKPPSDWRLASRFPKIPTDPKNPDSKPQQYYHIDDLPKPPLTVAWTEENVPELGAIYLRGLRELKVDKQKGLYPKASEAKKYFLAQSRSDGEAMSDKIADVLASACRPLKGMKGGPYKGGPKKG
jgi:hypothetical protein